MVCGGTELPEERLGLSLFNLQQPGVGLGPGKPWIYSGVFHHSEVSEVSSMLPGALCRAISISETAHSAVGGWEA